MRVESTVRRAVYPPASYTPEPRTQPRQKGTHTFRTTAAAVGDVAVSCSFQLTNQAIDSNQNSETEMHPHQCNKHQDSHLDTHSLCHQQKNSSAGETGERSGDANNNPWCAVLRHPRFLAARGEAARARGPIVRRARRD